MKYILIINAILYLAVFTNSRIIELEQDAFQTFHNVDALKPACQSLLKDCDAQGGASC